MKNIKDIIQLIFNKLTIKNKLNFIQINNFINNTIKILDLTHTKLKFTNKILQTYTSLKK